MAAIAIPASVVNYSSTSSLEQVTFALYQIARACVFFNVDEIIVYSTFEQQSESAAAEQPKIIRLDEPEEQPSKPLADLVVDEQLRFTANMLQYLITPVHLRKLLFKPIGNPQQFKYASKLPKIPGLVDNTKKIMQGIAMPRERKRRLPGQKKLSKKDRKEQGMTPYINLGFNRLFKLKNDVLVQTHSRVYVDLAKGEVVKTDTQEIDNGYSVRAVEKFSYIFTQSTVPDGYAQTIYIPCQQFRTKFTKPLIQEAELSSLPKEKLLLVFGKWNDVQLTVSNDSDLAMSDASVLFDAMALGTEKARVEDSVMVSLGRM